MYESVPPSCSNGTSESCPPSSLPPSVDSGGYGCGAVGREKEALRPAEEYE